MKLMSLLSALALLLCTCWPTDAQPPASDKLELKPNDHICFIGNSTAERMQHYGWLETYLHSRFPEHKLTFRNLGFAGDTLTTRLRSDSFGSPDQWLTKCQADVIFAFFGYNESFEGVEGLPKFKSDLEAFIKHTLSQKYNGKSAPRIVLFAPLAHENLKSPHLPDGVQNNVRLKLYTDALREAAKTHHLTFCDLYQLSQALYGTSKPLTINGIHLNEHGDQKVGQSVDINLFDKANAAETEYLEKLRAAVNDKNMHWFQRYRTTDGYSIYGGRADLKFTNNQTNREVAQREMEVLDVMTANRDKFVWQLAQKQQSKIDDSNLPPFIPVISNKPGKGPNGTHLFLSGEEAIKSMTVAKGFKVNLFADEKTFPELVSPVQMQFDSKGRLWVATWQTYPHWKPTEAMNDKLLIFEDTDGDGKADKRTVFAGDLHNPTGFEFYNGGVIVAQSPNIVFLKDTNGDDKYDTKEILISGIDSADTHHTSNSFTFDPAGGLYFQEGTFHQTSVETPYSAAVRCSNAGVFRYEPRTQKFETYVSFGFANPHGHVWDRWGRDIIVDGTGSNPYHGALFSGRVDYPNKHARPPQVYQQWTRPCSGMEILSSQHFPKELQGNLLVLNVIGYQGILMYKLRDVGGSIEGTEDTRLLSSSDPNFRPADIKMGPDGAIYFCDWHNPIIGHMQHNLRDPNRNKTYGRVYRMTYEGSPLSPKVKIDGEPIPKLLELLQHSEDRVRYRARQELACRPSDAVLKASTEWAAGDDKKLLESLWLHQSHHQINNVLLDSCLKSSNARIRAAAIRVLSYWRDGYNIPPTAQLAFAKNATTYDDKPDTTVVPRWEPEKVTQKVSNKVNGYDDTPPPTTGYVLGSDGKAADADIETARRNQAEQDAKRAILENKIVVKQQDLGQEYKRKIERLEDASMDLLYRGPTIYKLPISYTPHGQTLDVLHRFANDEDPRVRLEVARAASFLDIPEAIEIPLLILASKHGTDKYITFVCQETMKTLEPRWKAALARGHKFAMHTTTGERFLIKNTGTPALLKLDRNVDVCRELLTRPGIQDEYRSDALRNLARKEEKPQPVILLNTIRSLDQQADTSDKSIYFDLVRLLAARTPAELKTIRTDLEQLALTAQQPVIRQTGYVALMTVDNNIDAAWKLASSSKKPLQAEQDMVTATSMLSDTNLRGQMYDKIVGLLQRTTGNASIRQPVTGRFVRIELPGKMKALTLAEVEVYSNGQNVALKGKATQQNTAHGGVAKRAIDGNKSGKYEDGGQTHTSEASENPWWEVDLGSDFPIESILIYNRTDGTFYRRLNGFNLKVLDASRKAVWEQTKQPAPEKMGQYDIAPVDPQAALRSSAMIALTSVRGQEKKSFELLANLLKSEGSDRIAAIQALLRLPRNTWPADQASAVLDQVMTLVRKTPVSLRTSATALEAMELAESLTSLLPPDQAKPFRRELIDLGVRVIRIGTLLERMSYDKDVIVVQAGKPVEFIFENSDMMPHNLVISQPGTLEQIGEAAEAMATSADAQARHFVPQSDKILLASKLLQPRESERLSFTAPTKPGVYPIVCTYPGHWRRMYSALYVVSDLEGYQTGPDAYLAAHPVSIQDGLLKDRRPRTEWKYTDLEPLLADLKPGRSFGNGKQMFTVANCQACHRFNDVGNNFAPNLAELDPKWKAADLLKNIVEPSHLINEKYQTWVFAMNDGKTVTAIVLEETPDAYKVIENPLAKAEPRILKKADVEERKKSDVSTMPKGLLDTLSRDEILDLLAYIWSKGKPNHELFQGGKHDH
jgi:putative heme-binding domain-containing protein